jgi:hypothetical protein
MAKVGNETALVLKLAIARTVAEVRGDSGRR